METYLYSTFKKCCKVEGVSLAAWAEKNGFGNSMPTNLKNGIRPSTGTLKKMLSGFIDSKSSTEILMAYLKDEIERLGFSLDYIYPQLNENSERFSPLKEDLDSVIGFFAKNQPSEIVHKLAMMIKQIDNL